MLNYFILWAILTGVPLVAWCIAEFRGSTWARRTSAGILVAANLIFALVTAVAADVVVRLEYNMWYSSAAHQLVESVVTELGQGRVDEVVVELKRLDEEFYPTYEHLGNWDELAGAAAARLSNRSEEP